MPILVPKSTIPIYQNYIIVCRLDNTFGKRLRSSPRVTTSKCLYKTYKFKRKNRTRKHKTKRIRKEKYSLFPLTEIYGYFRALKPWENYCSKLHAYEQWYHNILHICSVQSPKVGNVNRAVKDCKYYVLMKWMLMQNLMEQKDRTSVKMINELYDCHQLNAKKQFLRKMWF